MKTKYDRAWKLVPGTLDEWNAKQRPKFRIVQTGGIVDGIRVDGPRVAEDEAGRTVAIEHQTPSTSNCFVLKTVGKPTDRTHPTPETLSRSTQKMLSGRKWV